MKLHRMARLLDRWLVIVVLLGLLVLPGTTRAQDDPPEEWPEVATDAQVMAVAPGAIPVQGRITATDGTPLNGTYPMTFRLYETVDAAAALCGDTREVVVKDGLFSDYMDHCYSLLTGQKVWLGIQVGDDPEMTPRAVIFPVPYAVGLVPGFWMKTSESRGLAVSNSNTTGKAIEAYASAATGKNYAIYATSASPEGTAGYFYNGAQGVGAWGASLTGAGVRGSSLAGTGVRASSAGGPALSLEGTGKLTSTARSYVWISGNSIEVDFPIGSNNTRTESDFTGGKTIYSVNPDAWIKVVVPTTLPGDLYGQPVRVVGANIYYQTGGTDDVITSVKINKRTGGCITCYAEALEDYENHACAREDHADGCTLSYDLTTNNEINAVNGILYIEIGLQIERYGGWVRIGGVRLTLEHD